MTDETRGWFAHRRAQDVMLACLVALFAAQVLRTAWVSDDAFISLRTIDNAVHGYGLRWNVDERVQTFTHPLWLFVVTPVYAVLRDPYYAVTLVSLVVSLATVVLLAFRSGLPARNAGLALVVLALSKAYVDYSTSGLENPLTHLLLLLFALELLRDAEWDGRALRIGLLAGLLGLNRLDLFALALPALALVLFRVRTARARVRLLAGLGPLVLWELFSILYYGSPFPNTTIAKLQTGVPSGALLVQGLAYLRNSLAWDPVTLVVIAAALVTAVIDRRPGRLALAAGVVLYLALVVKVGGDFMSGRFLTGPLLAAVVLLASRPWPNVRWFVPVTAAALVLLAAIAPRPAFSLSRALELSRAELVDAHGIADERRYYFNSSGLFNGAPGWTRPTASEAKLRARDLVCSGTPLAVEGAVGVTAFYAGPAVHVVDYHGLGDPLLARLPMVDADPLYAAFMRDLGKGVPASPWRIGHFLRSVPPGYLRTLLGGSNAIPDPGVARLWDRVRLVTRGPLFDGRRLAAVLASSVGLGGAGVRSERQPYRPTDWTEVLQSLPDSPEAMCQIGQVLFGANRYADAAEAFDAVLRHCPTHNQALLGIGNSRLALRDYAAAEAFGRRAMAASPDAQQGYVLTSFALRGQRRFADASAILENLAARDVTAAANAWELAGELWSEAGDRERARRSFLRALEFDPGMKLAKDNLQGL